MHELNEEIGKLLARAEQLGGEGNVDEAQQVLEKVEKTRALKREAEVRARAAVGSHPSFSGCCGCSRRSHLNVNI